MLASVRTIEFPQRFDGQFDFSTVQTTYQYLAGTSFYVKVS